MIALRKISRYRAATAHLFISATIASGALTAMLVFWFPPPYFKAMGGIELMALIVGVDIALGPLLTLIVFDVRKKSLPFDLLCIAALQLCALGYGVYAMHLGRPVFTVFTGQALAVVSAAEIDPDELTKGRLEEFRHLGLTGPKLVATTPPSDPQELANLVFAEMAGFGIQKLPRYYVPYAERKDALRAAMRPLDRPEAAGGIDAEKLRDYLGRNGKNPAGLRYLPVITHQGNMIGILDAVSGELLDIL